MKIKPKLIMKGIRCLKQYGPRECMIRAAEHLKPEEVPYGPWFEKHKLKEEEWTKQREDSENWKMRPLVSICVPLYKTPEKYLCEMIESVRNQTYSNWQLCLADGTEDDSVEHVAEKYCKEDRRICYEHLKENLGIAENTNAAFALAKGEWIGLLDHDDILAPEALYEVLAAAGAAVASASMVGRNRKGNSQPADVVYTDEDKVSEDLKQHFQPHFKPDFNPDLLCSNNYITHFFVVRRELVEQVGGFRREYDGSQDYDFIFRCTDAARRIVHVPRILYHWRTSSGSTADNPASKMYAYEAGKRAIEEHLRARGIAAEVSHTKSLGFYRVKYQLEGEPLITIVIANVNGDDALDQCMRSIRAGSYKNYEVVVVENNGSDGYNYGVAQAKGEYVVLLDSRVTILTEDWLEELAGHCRQERTAAAGCKLLYPDGTVYHAGIVVGIGEIAHNMFNGMRGGYYGYMHRAGVQMNYSAVDLACMMVKKSVFDEVGGLNHALSHWADVDLGLKMGQAGYRVVYTPYVKARYDISKQKTAKGQTDTVSGKTASAAYMKEHWASIFEEGDACYNPNFSKEKADYSLSDEA